MFCRLQREVEINSIVFTKCYPMEIIICWNEINLRKNKQNTSKIYEVEPVICGYKVIRKVDPCEYAEEPSDKYKPQIEELCETVNFVDLMCKMKIPSFNNCARIDDTHFAFGDTIIEINTPSELEKTLYTDINHEFENTNLKTAQSRIVKSGSYDAFATYVISMIKVEIAWNLDGLFECENGYYINNEKVTVERYNESKNSEYSKNTFIYRNNNYFHYINYEDKNTFICLDGYGYYYYHNRYTSPRISGIIITVLSIVFPKIYTTNFSFDVNGEVTDINASLPFSNEKSIEYHCKTASNIEIVSNTPDSCIKIVCERTNYKSITINYRNVPVEIYNKPFVNIININSSEITPFLLDKFPYLISELQYIDKEVLKNILNNFNFRDMLITFHLIRLIRSNGFIDLYDKIPEEFRHKNLYLNGEIVYI